jgi:hypothetical protein
MEEGAHSTPATPSTTRFSAVIVPVLSKQQTSTRPANGMRNGSVQNIATKGLNTDIDANCGGSPNFDKATREAFTAKDNSMGNSGGTTLVTINTQSSKSFDFFKFLSIP